jgi:hypothetical protein
VFSENWFNCHNDPAKAIKFLQKLNADKPIKELATNPLMLTLLCLVFSKNPKFPETRFELYEEGLNTWLEKWDNTRGIERDVIYKNLSRDRKKNLLSYLAFRTFTENKYFFKQADAEQMITSYIQNLPITIFDSGTCEQFHRTILEEFYQIAFRKKLYTSVEQLHLLRLKDLLNQSHLSHPLSPG